MNDTGLVGAQPAAAPHGVPPPQLPLRMLARLVGGRLLYGLSTLFAVSVVIFLAVLMLPGDAAEVLLGQNPDPETIAAYRKELGLDRPPVLRYVDWIGGVLQGDFGRSLASGAPIAELVQGRLRNTAALAVYAAVIALPIAFAVGLFSALRHGGRFDRASNAVSLTLLSSPQFMVAYLLVFVLAVKLPLFPSSADIRPDGTLGEYLYRTFLPALSLAGVAAAYTARMVRAALLDVLERRYIRMAVLKGVPSLRVVVHHALPNALGPIAAVLALVLAQLILGVVVIETVFVYPGLGQLLVDSVSKRDITVVQGVSLIFAATYVLLNLLADLVSLLSNPRLLYPRSQ